VNGRHQNFFLTLEIEIDGPVGDIGSICNIGYARGEEAFLGEDGDRCIQNALVFVGVAIPGRDG
jgi:hypothetical protein